MHSNELPQRHAGLGGRIDPDKIEDALELITANEVEYTLSSKELELLEGVGGGGEVNGELHCV